jgi:hypothetical protein
MSATYPWIKDSGTISGAPTGRLAVTSTSGMYLYNNATSILSEKDKDLTIETDGTGSGSFKVKTGSNERLTISSAGVSTFSGNVSLTNGVLTVNNTTGGGTNDPVLVLNQNVNGAILYEERTNSKTAVNGADLYQISYKGLNNATVPQTVEYANIKVTPTSINQSGMQASTISFKTNQSLPATLSINSSAIQSYAPLSMNSNTIYNVSGVTTSGGNALYPDLVVNMDGNPSSSYTMSFFSEFSLRLLYKNIGLSSTLQPITQTYPASDVYCSATFDGRLWIGTTYYIYYSTDGGASWNPFLNTSSNAEWQFFGAIKTMKEYSGFWGTYLVIGGEFSGVTDNSGTTKTLNYTAYITPSSYDLLEMNWGSYAGSVGFDNYVNVIEVKDSYLYYGGDFSGISGSSVGCFYFAIVNLDNSIGWVPQAINNNNGNGANGRVFSILLDTTTSNGYLIVGGNFTNFGDIFFSPISCSGILYIIMTGSSLNGGTAIDLQGTINCMIIRSSSIIVGGSYFWIGGVSNLTTLTWDIGTSNYVVSYNPYYPTYNPSTYSITFLGLNGTNNDIYWGEASSYNLVKNGVVVGTSSTNNIWLTSIYLSGYNGGTMAFAPYGGSSNQKLYYIGTGIMTLSTSIYNVVNNGTVYTAPQTITFPQKGTSILLEWNSNNSTLSVISNNGCTGIGLSSGGGISTISAGSGISVSSPTGPTTTISNSGVLALTNGTNTTVSNIGGGIWQVNASGGGGGGDVYWSQLNDAYTTYQNLSGGSSYNNPYTFGLNSGSTLPGNVSNSVVNMQINNDEIRYLAPSSSTSSYNIPYIKVGQNENGSGQPQSSYTLLANVTDSTDNQYTTLATVNSNMHLYANKAASTIPEQGTGEMYLYANNILPGNFVNQPSFGATTNLGDSSYYWASVASATFNTISDIKTKDNIEKIDINYAKNLITKVNPVSYNLKTDKSQNKKKNFGFIAQEIKEIIGDQNLGLHIDGETQAISYTDFIAPLIKTVQYLLQKVEYLELQVKELKK